MPSDIFMYFGKTLGLAGACKWAATCYPSQNSEAIIS